MGTEIRAAIPSIIRKERKLFLNVPTVKYIGIRDKVT